MAIEQGAILKEGSTGLIKDVVKHTFVIGASDENQYENLTVESANYANKKLILNIEETTITSLYSLYFSLILNNFDTLKNGESILLETRSLQARGNIDLTIVNLNAGFGHSLSMNATYLITKELTSFSVSKIANGTKVIDFSASSGGRRVGFGKYICNYGGAVNVTANISIDQYEELEIYNRSTSATLNVYSPDTYMIDSLGSSLTSYSVSPNSFFKLIYFHNLLLIR